MSIVISCIVAKTKNGVIGKDNTLPWRLSTDLQRFKSLTFKKPIIMGRRTWQSIGRPLRNRFNIVVTRNNSLKVSGVACVSSLEAGISLAYDRSKIEDVNEVFIIGGGEIFAQALSFTKKLYITEILTPIPIEGDTFFPYFDITQWKSIFIKYIAAGIHDSHPTRFVIYERTLRQLRYKIRIVD